MFVLLWLFVGVTAGVHSWDIAVTRGDYLELYSKKEKILYHGTPFTDLSAVTYDAINDLFLFVNKRNDSDSIFTYNLKTRTTQPLVKRNTADFISGLAFDPIDEKVFWVDKFEKGIFSVSLKPESKNNNGKLFLNLHDQFPIAVAVDSCNGYIYWANTNFGTATIERAKLDGSGKEVIIEKDISQPVSLAIDYQTKTLYWIDDGVGIHYSIGRSDLDGKNVRYLYNGTDQAPTSLTVSKDSLYWINREKVWTIPKHINTSGSVKPIEYMAFPEPSPAGIVANYIIEDQIKGVPECKILEELLKKQTNLNDTAANKSDNETLCLQYIKLKEEPKCECNTTDRKEEFVVDVCNNFCFQGVCFANNGQPKCRCKEGYRGKRCEIEICRGFCLNDGECSVYSDQQAFCKCPQNYEGIRCEKVKTRAIDPPRDRTTEEPANEVCNCTTGQNTTSAAIHFNTDSSNPDADFVEVTCNEGWDSVRDPIIMILGISCGLLCVACAYLLIKVMQLKKRPRIKKRIIVNKNVTPMTARPEQCEITIENCCNMNICETPCFEPRSTIRPSLLDTKPGKEEKKNLISNMELPDDY